MSFRSFLYKWAKAIGDVNAVDRAIKQGSLRPIGRRLRNRAFGRIAGLILRHLDRR